MKRIYSTIILLCCATCFMQLVAQNQGRMTVRRGETQSSSTNQNRNTTPQSRQGTTGTVTSRAGTTGTTTVTRPTTPATGETSTQQVQPSARARQESAKTENTHTGVSIRMQTQYNAQREVPSELIWKREIYRTLDLSQEENAGLGDPATPIGNRVNLFTLIFQLLAEKKIQAYEYTLDGNVMIDDNHKADFKNVLDRFQVYYRRKRIAATNDTVFVIDNSDVPSNEVQSYFIKETWFYDQHNSSFHTAVTALCPVLHRSGDFDTNVIKYPMFWINVEDLAPYMNQISISTSPYNNAATMSLDDFFTLQMYKGEIYKTNNPSGKILVQSQPSDSTVIKERQLIENQLESVEDNMWKNQTLTASADSTAQENPKNKKTDEDTEKEANTRRAPKEEKVSKAKSSSSSGGNSAPKATVRRQRR